MLITMANATKVSAIMFCALVFLQVSSGGNVRVPAVMTVNSFQQGGSGGGPASCDGQYHSGSECIVSLSSDWYAGGKRCGKMIRIKDNSSILGGITVIVVDEYDGCDGELGASPAVWHNFGLDPNLGEVNVTWYDLS